VTFALDRSTETLSFGGKSGARLQQSDAPGANLFTNSVVALDARSGTLSGGINWSPTTTTIGTPPSFHTVQLGRQEARRNGGQGRRACTYCAVRTVKLAFKLPVTNAAQPRRAASRPRVFACVRSPACSGTSGLQPNDRTCSTSTQSTGARYSSSADPRGLRPSRSQDSPMAGARTTRSTSGMLDQRRRPRHRQLRWRSSLRHRCTQRSHPLRAVYSSLGI